MSNKGEFSMKRSLMPLGLILVLVGVVYILFQAGLVLLQFLWPLFILLIGWLLHRWFFRGNAPAIVLIPGGLFVVSSLPLLYGNWVSWSDLSYLWPLFVFGLAIGIYEYHKYSYTKDQMMFLLSISLGVVAVIALAVTLFIKLSFLFLAALLILGGFFLIRRAR
jgi:hypothetical protein